jgi:DDE superfamily endonuclease
MMLTKESLAPHLDQDVAAVQGGAASVADIERRLAPYCERAAPRQRAMAYLRGLLSPAERKHSWPLADVSGDTTPYAFQHLLRRARWDPEAVREERRTDVLQPLGDPNGVRVLDKTGLLKKGRTRPGSPANIAARLGGWRTASSACCWAMPVGWATSCSTANSLGPRSGPMTGPVVGRQVFRTRDASRPSPSWPGRCCTGRWQPACLPSGSCVGGLGQRVRVVGLAPAAGENGVGSMAGRGVDAAQCGRRRQRPALGRLALAAPG